MNSIINKKYKYSVLTGKIIGCAMEVHTKFWVMVFKRALAIEMEKQGLGFSREHEMTIYYKDVNIGTRRVDFFCWR